MSNIWYTGCFDIPSVVVAIILYLRFLPPPAPWRAEMLIFTRCSSEGRLRTTRRSCRWGSQLEAPVGRMTELPGQRPERWVEGCSSRGLAGQRKSRGTECRAGAEGWSPAETQSGYHCLSLSLVIITTLPARSLCGNSGLKSEEKASLQSGGRWEGGKCLMKY